MKERIKKGTYYLMITDYMENNKVYAGSMTTGKFNKNTLNWYLENGYQLEQVNGGK